jgi:hypothetical protein
LRRKMKTHQQIDRRSLAMAEAIVSKIDQDPQQTGMLKARATCSRWMKRRATPANREWLEILDRPWEEIRALLLEDSERGRRLRQNDPFCGILTPQERWAIYSEYREEK